jgi:hypothetical protein
MGELFRSIRGSFLRSIKKPSRKDERIKYLSIVVASRLDGYGDNQELRMQLFLNHLEINSKLYLHDIPWELVIVDWNPPSSEAQIKNSLVIRDYPELPIRHVTYCLSDVEITEERLPFNLHKALNVGIFEAKGTFCLISNFDCFFSREIFETIGAKQIGSNYLYLADRLDVANVSLENWLYFSEAIESRTLESYPQKNGILNVRHTSNSVGEQKPITLAYPYQSGDLTEEINRYEQVVGSIVSWKWQTAMYFWLYMFRAALKKGVNVSETINLALSKFGIHTNASGDFILAPLSALREVGGFSILAKQYWHLDSDLVFKLLKSGLLHASFIRPARVTHLTTEFSGGGDSRYINSHSYADMCKRWVEMWKMHL